jgi:hypothetical protein
MALSDRAWQIMGVFAGVMALIVTIVIFLAHV